MKIQENHSPVSLVTVRKALQWMAFGKPRKTTAPHIHLQHGTSTVTPSSPIPPLSRGEESFDGSFPSAPRSKPVRVRRGLQVDNATVHPSAPRVDGQEMPSPAPPLRSDTTMGTSKVVVTSHVDLGAKKRT